MPTFNTITGAGTPPPLDSSYGEEVIIITQQSEPEAPDPSAPWLGDGYDVGPATGSGNVGMDPGRNPQAAQPQTQTNTDGVDPPPYEPAPGTDPVSRAAIKIVDFLHSKEKDLLDFAKALDKRIPVYQLENAHEAGKSLGQDASNIIFSDTLKNDIIGPKPGHEPRPKPWIW